MGARYEWGAINRCVLFTCRAGNFSGRRKLMSALRNSYLAVAHPRRKFFSQRLTANGVLVGDSNMIEDYSGVQGPVDFWCEPNQGAILNVSSIVLLVSDNGAPGEDDYGNINNGLDVGVQFFAEVEGQRIYSPVVLKNNIDIIGASSAFRIHELSNSVRVLAYQRFFDTFSDDFQIPDRVPSKFGVEVHDDFTGLHHHVMWVNGNQQINKVAQWAMAAILSVVPFVLHTGVTI